MVGREACSRENINAPLRTNLAPKPLLPSSLIGRCSAGYIDLQDRLADGRGCAGGKVSK
jgi:hypothetical protein